MSEKQNKEYPYQRLGLWLKAMRQKRRQSLAEVSGAVEIDSDFLSDIEQGMKRPSEDILMLLISYFSVKEDEAVKLWEMAGYGKTGDDGNNLKEQIQPVVVMPMDARIVYTDMVHVTTNKYGVTLNFLQADGIGGQPLAVSRVGMSRDHAQSLLEILQKSLQPIEQKLLPSPKLETSSEDLSEK